ncbi:isopenicillin N synthase family dioxygenase [Halotalea alkalilenta]|nr:2-oxoglutarate and iron-dependent oxygenase domain-containing protein [Halotalea alkalilenta]
MMTEHYPRTTPAASANSTPAASRLVELDKEARMGARGVESDATAIPLIDLSDFDARREEIADELWNAATEVGFFQLDGHGIALEEIRAAFSAMEAFFSLPEAVKARYPLQRALNVGWESKAQVRPSTRTPDQKESYQITRPHMEGLWPSEEELAGFRAVMLDFERKSWQVGMRVLSCFADRLGFPREFFTEAHDPARPSYQSTLRLLHYFALDAEQAKNASVWRAGAHTDFDCLTLLFQREGQGGLQVCPGRDLDEPVWTNVEPREGVITCNIGDMLMRWSDDRLKSNFHRVKSPATGGPVDERYSLAFFCQANRDAVIEGPAGKYPPMTAQDYLQGRVNANFAALADGAG